MMRPPALDLLNAVDGPIVRVTADAAYDTVAVYETATARGATVVIPPARTANVSAHGPRSPARDRTIAWVKTLGTAPVAEGVRVPSSEPGGEHVLPLQVHHWSWPSRPEPSWPGGVRLVLGCEILNRMTELGRPVSYRIGR